MHAARRPKKRHAARMPAISRTAMDAAFRRNVIGPTTLLPSIPAPCCAGVYVSVHINNYYIPMQIFYKNRSTYIDYYCGFSVARQPVARPKKGLSHNEQCQEDKAVLDHPSRERSGGWSFYIEFKYGLDKTGKCAAQSP